MSLTALSWSIKQLVPRSTQKFVLVMLANYADEYGRAYPSIERLCKDTCQDRKTVIEALDSLLELGLIRDTGHRVGRTGSVIIYELCGIPDLSKVHYVYKLTDPATGEFYIGKRSFNSDPELDIYRGSGKWCHEVQKKKITIHREILSVFSSDTEALTEECRLLRLHQDDPKIKNLGTPKVRKAESTKLYREGMTTGEAVPFFPASSPVFPPKQSQKRDTDPKGNSQLNEREREEGKSLSPATQPDYREERRRASHQAYIDATGCESRYELHRKLWERFDNDGYRAEDVRAVIAAKQAWNKQRPDCPKSLTITKLIGDLAKFDEELANHRKQIANRRQIVLKRMNRAAKKERETLNLPPVAEFKAGITAMRKAVE